LLERSEITAAFRAF